MSENKTQQELDFERKHEQDLQRLRGLRLIDDDFMAAVFEDPACARIFASNHSQTSGFEGS